MASIDAPLSNCKVYIYPGDHNPPHFHLTGPNSRASIDMVTLEIIAGKASKKDLAEVKEWAAKPENLAALVWEWRRLNERE
jgi:hypothetical protein